MNLLTPFMLVLTSACFTAEAQMVTPTLADSLRGTATLDKRVFKAGESIAMTVTLAVPAPRAITASAIASCAVPVSVAGKAQKGDRAIHLEGLIDPQVSSAHCSMTEMYIAPPAAQEQGLIVLGTTMKFPSQDFDVIGIPRVAETFGGQVTVELNLSERQYLRSRTVSLRTRLNLLSSRLDLDGSETVSLDTFILSTLVDARRDLLDTRDEFQLRYRRNGTYPVFFDDLDRRYSALIIDIRAHRTQISIGSEAPHLLKVQVLGTHPNKPRKEVGPRMNGTYPPDAGESLRIIEWNIDVYTSMADSGRETFTISIVSLPGDATVSARRIGEAFTVLGSRTTIPQAKFPIALWKFKFSRLGCIDYPRDFDPVHDSSTSLEVELTCAK